MEHRCEAMMRVRDSGTVDDVLIHYYQGSRPETSRWYLTFCTYDGVHDLPNVGYCPFCGADLAGTQTRRIVPSETLRHEWREG